jgi:hypothetical protein
VLEARYEGDASPVKAFGGSWEGGNMARYRAKREAARPPPPPPSLSSSWEGRAGKREAGRPSK